MTARTNTLDYWLNWRFFVCAFGVFSSMLIAIILIWKYEGSNLGEERAEAEEGAVGTLYDDESWRPCLKEIHPAWLLAFRVIAFFVLAALLVINVAVQGAEMFYFYTQWTFALVTIYFGVGSLLSIYGCQIFHSKVECNMLSQMRLDVEQGTYLAPITAENTNTSDRMKRRGSQEEYYVRPVAGFWGYAFQIIYQTNAGAVMLTDCVFWLIIVPFLTMKDYSLNFFMIGMHSVNAIFLLGDTALNSLRFPLFRISYFLLWTAVYVIFQWVIHACIPLWWPYPFLDLSSSYAPLWYFSVALMHIPCYAIFASPAFDRDRIWLNGKEISLSGGRYQNCLRELRRRARDVEIKEKGIRIRGEDWEHLHIHIASYNNFPTAAGLASSAAGFACLVFSLSKLMNVNEDDGDLSCIARQGSGSACRSLYGGFVKWQMGNDLNGNDSTAIQLANESHWNDLVILIAVVSSRQKETSSTAGMRDSVETSSLLDYRAKAIVPQRILKMEEAIRNRDFKTFAQLTCADSNQFHAVCLDTSPPIFYMNDTSHRIINSVERWSQFEGKPQVAYTFDAGPNAVLIAPSRKIACLLLQRLLFYFPPQQDNDLTSYVIGDTSILQEAGLHSNKDVEALPPPPEIKDKAPYQKYPGDISYFICTRPGRGPVLLSEDQALLHPETGMPK